MNKLKYENLDLNSDQDVAEVARLHCEAPREWVVDHSCSEDSLTRAIESLRSSENRCHVVLARTPSDKIIGLHWVELEERIDAKFGNVSSLWVHPTYRQQGVGTRLKELAEAWLSSNGASEIRSQVYVENRKMMALNEKLGYKVVLVGMSKRLE